MNVDTRNVTECVVSGNREAMKTLDSMSFEQESTLRMIMGVIRMKKDVFKSMNVEQLELASEILKEFVILEVES